MGLYSEELDGLNLDELEQQFERNGNYSSFYDEVAQYIAEQGTIGLSYLKKVVQEDKMEVPQLRAALWILSLQEEEPWYREKLQTLLQDSRELIVAEAIDDLASFKARDLSERI